MKKIVSLLLFIIAVQSNTTLSQHQSNAAQDSISVAKRQFVLAEIARFPFSHWHSTTWQSYQSVRIGYGQKLHPLLELRVYAEYTCFDFDANDPRSDLIYSQGRRRDVAVYPTIVAFRIIELALGGYYKVQDEVLRKQFYPIASPSPTTFKPAASGFGVYVHYGLCGSIPIYHQVNVALGLFVRYNLESGGTYAFGGRAGLKYEI